MSKYLHTSVGWITRKAWGLRVLSTLLNLIIAAYIASASDGHVVNIYGVIYPSEGTGIVIVPCVMSTVCHNKALNSDGLRVFVQ